MIEPRPGVEIDGRDAIGREAGALFDGGSFIGFGRLNYTHRYRRSIALSLIAFLGL
jgi:hypothetical protein